MPPRTLATGASRDHRGGSARARPILLASCFVAWAATCSGCLVTPRQTQSAAQAPPPRFPKVLRAPRSRPGSGHRLRRPTFKPRPRTASRSRCTSTSDESSSRRAISRRPCRNTRRRSPWSRPSGTARWARPIPRWRTGAWRAASTASGGSPRPRFTIRKRSSSRPETRRSGMTWATATISRAAGPTPSAALKTAAKLAPDDERIRINLGLTLAAAGKATEALPLLSQTTGDAAGHANLGYLLAATGQFELARGQYETALAQRPDMELARRALARLDRQQRSPAMAEETRGLVAQKPRAAAHPVDARVQPAGAATSSTTVPPPRSWSFPESARAPRERIDPAGAEAAQSALIDVSKLPTPPPP